MNRQTADMTVEPGSVTGERMKGERWKVTGGKVTQNKGKFGFNQPQAVDIIYQKALQ